MKRLKITVVVVLASLIALGFLSRCGKSADIVMPTIIQLNASQSVGDTLVFKMTGNVIIDGQNYPPDSINWAINDESGNNISPESVNFDIMKFVAQNIGQFTITAKLLYDGNKRITVFKQLVITSSAAFLQKKLIGNWSGTAQNYYGTTWSYTFQVDSSNGHYFAKLTGGGIPCVTWYGEGNENIHTQLKRFVINNILNDRATGYWYVYYGDSLGNGNAVPYDIRELRFTANYNQLDFEFFPADQHYSYTMTRQ